MKLSTCPATTPSHTLPIVFVQKLPAKYDDSDQNAGHAAQLRRTCDQLSLSTAPCRQKRRQAPPPASSHGSGQSGFAVRGSRKIAPMMQSTCCRNPRATIGKATRMLQRCLAPGRASASERQWLGRTVFAVKRGGCGKEPQPGETKISRVHVIKSVSYPKEGEGESKSRPAEW